MAPIATFLSRRYMGSRLLDEGHRAFRHHAQAEQHRVGMVEAQLPEELLGVGVGG